MQFISFLVIFATLAVAFGYSRNELVIQDNIEWVIKTKQPLMSKGQLPESLDYRTDGLLTTDLNQHIPVYCGSCWAHAAFSTIADRIKIATKGKQRDVIPSVQALINCGNAGSCNGGDSNAAFAYVQKNGIPDVTCQQYQAKNMECSAINTCMNCDPGSNTCEAVPKGEYPAITISEFGGVRGDENIMSEIAARGPVAAYIDANCIEEYTGGVNMYDTCRGTTNHAIQINGWGTENGTDYWIGRNSWGTYWGEHGFFRIVRGGKYNVGTAYWAVPDIPEF
jgi:cathepsin X